MLVFFLYVFVLMLVSVWVIKVVIGVWGWWCVLMMVNEIKVKCVNVVGGELGVVILIVSCKFCCVVFDVWLIC